MRQIFSLIALGLFTTIHSGCPLAPESGPDLDERLATEVSHIVRANGFPGMTAAAALPDGTAISVAIGMADRESGAPMTRQSRMLAASIGKTFVAATILALDQEELLHLDDPISMWLSNRGWFERLPNYHTATILHLLTHTSGLPDHIHDDQSL